MDIACAWSIEEIVKNLIIFIKAFLSLFGPLIAALIAYFLGRKAYYDQKEYELIRERYLDECIDVLSEQIDQTLILFRYNWQHSLTILKFIRDVGPTEYCYAVNSELYQNGYKDIFPVSFSMVPNYRFNVLTKTLCIYKIVQSLNALLLEANEVFQQDLGIAEKIIFDENNDTLQSKEVYDKFKPIIIEYSKKIEPYYQVLYEIQLIASVLETERFTFKTLKNFHIIEKVQQSIINLEKLYTDIKTTAENEII